MESDIWQGVMQFFEEHIGLLTKLGVLVLIALIILYLVRLLALKLEERIEQADITPERKTRVKTIQHVSITALRASVISVILVIALGAIGIDLSPLLASAGLAGLALSLGAQALIKDFIGGLLIVLEDQFGVGDLVEIQGMRGTVEKITLRSVSLREFSGRLIYLSNGDIRTVVNASRDWNRAVVELTVSFDANIGAVVQALEEAMRAAYQDEAANEFLLEMPEVTGWNGLSEWGVQIQLAARAKAGRQANAAAILLRYALEYLVQRGICPAHPTQDIRLIHAD